MAISHGNHATISVHVCTANRAKRVARCPAGFLVGQAVFCHPTDVIVELTVLEDVTFKDGGFGRFSQRTLSHRPHLVTMQILLCMMGLSICSVSAVVWQH